jgi:nucleolar MIF4G domain-containing protein 1
MGICFHLDAGCGMKLRGDDPGAMKYFVLGIQNSVSELKLHSGVREDGETQRHGKRVIYLAQYTYFKKHYFPDRF